MGKFGKKNKASSTQIIFNEDARKDYLLGFRKRKLQRREKAKQEQEELLKKEKKRQRELKAQAILEERGQNSLPMSRNQVVFETNNVIETEDNEIIIRDFSSSFKPEANQPKKPIINQPISSFKQPAASKNKPKNNKPTSSFIKSKSKKTKKNKPTTKLSKRQKNKKKRK